MIKTWNNEKPVRGASKHTKFEDHRFESRAGPYEGRKKPVPEQNKFGTQEGGKAPPGRLPSNPSTVQRRADASKSNFPFGSTAAPLGSPGARMTKFFLENY
jgi:hypothetical protein